MPTLFGVSISTQLKELDLMSMTPLDAMNKLYELQQQAKQEEWYYDFYSYLDDITVDKIAAGEVVERPASVIKELVENSIDAHADKIEVEILAGGTSFMRVTDNGDGMDNQNARLAILRHATSKIKQVDDLMSIDTLGFRGEALPSIAAVSRFNLITRRPQDD